MLKLLEFREVYGDFRRAYAAPKGVNLTIGEAKSFLGPSVCGKSALLIILAGFERASCNLLLNGWTELPHDRACRW